MDRDQFRGLQAGDILRHAGGEVFEVLGVRDADGYTHCLIINPQTETQRVAFEGRARLFTLIRESARGRVSVE